MSRVKKSFGGIQAAYQIDSRNRKGNFFFLRQIVEYKDKTGVKKSCFFTPVLRLLKHLGGKIPLPAVGKKHHDGFALVFGSFANKPCRVQCRTR